MSRRRCPWADGSALLADYHDREWGVPVHEDRRHFEFLILEGAQAGLSWETVLRKREAYRRAFARFDPRRVARFGAADLRRLLRDPGLIRNRAKLRSAVANARAFLAVQGEHGSFDAYVWDFVGGKPIRNRFSRLDELPAWTAESAALSADLKRRGFSFVGPTVVYAHMQATGLVNDHLTWCFRYRKVS